MMYKEPEHQLKMCIGDARRQIARADDMKKTGTTRDFDITLHLATLNTKEALEHYETLSKDVITEYQKDMCTSYKSDIETLKERLRVYGKDI